MTLYKVRTVYNVEEEFLVHWADDVDPTAEQLNNLLPKSASRVLATTQRLITYVEAQPQSES